jgi:gamma-glutamyltranspeptidase / glutathione hydrolase
LRSPRPWVLALAIASILAITAAGSPPFARAAGDAPTAAAPTSSPAPVTSDRGMVASSVAPAVPVGVTVLSRGGNAVDAAIATGFAIGCAHQFASGIGGGGFLLIWDAKEKTAFALDARETAPAELDPRTLMQPDGKPIPNVLREGGRSVAVPSLVQGFAEAHRRFGRLPWRDVIAPAAELCRSGVAVTPYHASILESAREKLDRHPETAVVQRGTAEAPLAVGAKLVQADLANTYRRIAAGGADVMRRGTVAEAMVEAARADGGALTLADLAGYQPVWREPVRGTYRGHEVVSMPPPSSGGVHVVQMLNALERFDLRRSGAGTSRTLHVLGEAMKLAFADRALLLGDPDFEPVPVEWLVSKRYGAEMARAIAPPFWRKAPWRWGRPTVLRVREGKPPVNDAGTSHVSVMDADGNAVTLTQTVNTFFGSGLTAPGTGIVLNNEMDDFAIAPGVPNSFGLVGSGANAVEPLKRPLSSMSPTIVLRDGQPVLVVGSPQGPYIITTVLQTVINVLDFGMNVQQAAAAPRVHHQWSPDQLQVEPEVPAAVVEALQRMGHPVKQGDRFGASTPIARDPATGRFYGGADPRRDTAAAGPGAPTAPAQSLAR